MRNISFFLLFLMCCPAGVISQTSPLKDLLSLSQEQLQSDPRSALRSAIKADSLAALNQRKDIMFEAGTAIANIYLQIGNLKQASRYLNRNERFLKDVQSRTLLAAFYKEKGVLRIKMGNHEAAKQLIQKADSLFLLARDSASAAACKNNMGVIYESTGDYDQSLKSFMEALSIYSELKDSLGQATSIMNVGNIYYYTESFEKALAAYRHAAGMDSMLKRFDLMASALNNIGGIYYDLGKTDTALIILNRVINIQRLDGNYNGMAESMINLSLIYGVNENYDSAFASLERSILISRKHHCNELLCQALLSKGDLYRNMTRYELAAGNYLTAAQMAESYGLKNELKSAYEGLSSVYEKMGAFDKAHEYDKLLMHVKDSIYNLEKTARLSEMQTKYEVEQKDKAIEINKLKLSRQQLALKKSRILRIALIIGILFLAVVVFIIFKRYHEKRKANRKLARQNLMIEQQRLQLEEKNQNVTDSINYGKRLQETMLPEEHELGEAFQDQFIFFRPRNIVSGDFYWFYDSGDIAFVAVADCTGHGVPGALVSMMGSNLLNQLVIEKAMRDPGEILTELNTQVAKVFKKEGASQHASDGMDIALFGLHQQEMKLLYAGAYRPLVLIRNGKLTELPPDHRPIGGRTIPGYRFSTKKIDVLPGDICYAFSDGYPDQFGGEKGKKFLVRRFKEMLINISHKSMAEQLKQIDTTFKEWQGNEEQVDDILVLGLKV